MKELQQHIKPATANIRKAEIKSTVATHKLIPRPGEQCYEMNITTAEVQLAEISDVATSLKGDVSTKIIRKPGHIYLCASNKTQAIKRFLKEIKKGIKKL